jgi:hypothetical protein
VSWLNDVSARKERAAADKIGVSRERDFHDIPATLKQAEYIERHVSGRISPFPAIELAKYTLVEHIGDVRLIPIRNNGKRITGTLSSDDVGGWDGAVNAGDDLAERFLSASTRPLERAPFNPCRAWQPKAGGGMTESVKARAVAEYEAAGGKSRILPIAWVSLKKLYPWPRQRARILAATRDAAAREALAEMDRLNDAIGQIIDGAQHEHVGVAAASRRPARAA